MIIDIFCFVNSLYRLFLLLLLCKNPKEHLLTAAIVFHLNELTFPCRPLKKMTVGMFLAALAFIAAALVQIQIEVCRKHLNNPACRASQTHDLMAAVVLQKTLPKFPSETEGQVKFINMVERRLDVTAGNNSFSLEPFAVRRRHAPPRV